MTQYYFAANFILKTKNGLSKAWEFVRLWDGFRKIQEVIQQHQWDLWDNINLSGSLGLLEKQV